MLSGPIPVLVLRAAQFHEFVAQLVEWGRQGEVSYVPKMRTQLIDKPLTGTYRTAHGQNVRRGLRISRADVAHLLLRVLEQPHSMRQSIAIAY